MNIPDNVKRATLTWWKTKSEYALHKSLLVDVENRGFSEDEQVKWALRSIGLQEALDLLHFTAERANCPTNVRYMAREGVWSVSTFEPRPNGLLWGPPNSESLLHAVLLAIDAIVAHKPEVFA